MDATLLLQRVGTVSRPPGLAMLWILLLCTLMAQCASAATTTTNSTITSSPLGEGRNGSSGDVHQIRLLVLKFKVVEEALVITLVVLLAGLSKIVFHHADFLSSRVPESCILIVLGTIFGAILYFSKISEDLQELFSPDRFFMFLLPPIILESAFSLYNRTFSENIGTVLLFAVVGTIISCFLIGLSLYGLMLSGAMGSITHMSLIQVLVFSAFIVAVDPVVVLEVFTKIGVNDVLYFIFLGESLFNYGVTVMLYKVMLTYITVEDITADQIILGIVKFFLDCIGGLLIGVIAGVVTALLTRLTVNVGVTQPLVIYTMVYLGFLVSELFELSGIISIIACALVQRHYAFSNISYQSRTTVEYFTKAMASASEIIIFLFLGLALVSDHHVWHTGFVLWTLLLCTVFRFILTFGMASLINRSDTTHVRVIGYDEMFMIAFGGLRGDLAFSLAELLNKEELPMKYLFVTTTLAIIMFTVFFQGITIKPLAHLLSITLAPEKNQSMCCELNSHVMDHLMAGIENVVGMQGQNHIRRRIDHFDSVYLKKWLMNKPNPIDAGLQDFFTKIVIKEHYRNLKLCGAANVEEPPDLPRIDTNLSLSSTVSKNDNALVAQQSTEEQEQKEPEMETAVLRRRPSAFNNTTSHVSDWQGLRELLQSQQAAHLTLHSSYDRNLTPDRSSTLQDEIIRRSMQNRQLQRLMSTAGSRCLERAASSTDKDAQIALERGAGGSSKLKSASKQAVSMDLGTILVAYRPLTPRQPTPGSPASPRLESVLEENEESSTGLTRQAGKSEAIPEDGDGKEAHLLENKEDPQNVSIQSMSAFVTSGPQRSSQSSRRGLQQQDAKKVDDFTLLESGDSV